MGEIKIKIDTDIQGAENEGSEILEATGNDIQEANDVKGQIEGMEGADDKVTEAIAAAPDSAREIASEKAEEHRSEMENPTGALDDLSAEAAQYETTERAVVDQANAIQGDYSSVGSEIASVAEASAEGFSEQKETADSARDELESNMDSSAQELEGVF